MSALPRTADFVVIGGGVVGLSIALELRERQPGASIVVLEKESDCGLHASGRNSGVLHAGFYYTADSLKARLCVEGNRRLSRWCDERGVTVRRCGKLVVARDESEHAGLDELLRRAKANGVELEEVDEDEARRIEPCIRTAGRALWSPTTSAVSPREVMTAMAVQASELGIVIRTSTAWCGRAGSTLCMQTTKGDIDAGYVINAAGLFADRVARAFDFGEGYCMLPFRGVYLYGNANAPKLNVHVYPVPDLDMPFLGLHFTVTVDGRVKIGPTAMPTMWREGYGLDFDSLSRFQPRDLWEIATAGTRMLLSDGTFRNHARGEARKLMRGYLVRNAAEMLRGIKVADFDEWGAPGIRAQLYDENKGELVMDFHIEGDDRSMHVLNAVSPAFTCAFAFAEHLVDEVYTRSS